MQNDNDTGFFAVVILILLGLWLLFHYNDKVLLLWQASMVFFGQGAAWLAGTEVGIKLMHALDRDPATIQKIAASVGKLDAAGLKSLDYAGAYKYGDYLHRVTTLVLAPVMIYIGLRLHKHSSMDNSAFGVIVGVPAMAKVLANGAGRGWMREVKDLTKAPLFEGPIAEQAPITPWRLAMMYGIAQVDEYRQLKAFDMERAAKFYEGTLGNLFTSVEALSKGSMGELWQRLLSQIPAGERKSAIDYAVKGHLYEKTVVIALFRGMNKSMIVDPGPLQVIRYKDLAMFDALFSASRRTSFAAGAGIMGQYRYEVALYNATKPKGAMKPEEKTGAQWGAQWLEEALRTDPFESPWCEGDDVWKNFDPMY